MTPHRFEERLVTVENLNLTLGENVIIRDMNLHIDNVVRPGSGIEQGQVVALLGPSGIGKTQLFRCLAGLQQPTSGTVTLGPDKKPVEVGQVGIVFQNYPLMYHRSIADNLLIAAKGAGKKEEEAQELVKLFQLDSKWKSYPHELSGGQRQRISIIQQLLCSDHFILMDEPFSGLDIVSKQRMVDQIRTVSTVHELNTMIVTTHDLETAIEIADTIWVIGREKDKDGKVIPGATLIKSIDLIERDLAWHKDVRHAKNFRSTCDELYSLFNSL